MTEASEASRITSPFSRFEVYQEVGRGAAGIVFRAADRITGDAVALKVIARPDADAEQRAQFLDEGHLLSEIEHPSIVRIVDFGTLGASPVELVGQHFGPETPYIAMEWLTGTDLERRHAGTPLSFPETLQCVSQLGSALAAAHAHGVVHRDVKPSNVFVLDGDPMTFKLVDFGVACASDDMSAMGAMVGTPAYMAPEQARGDTATDPRCDVYSLGRDGVRAARGPPATRGAHADRNAGQGGLDARPAAERTAGGGAGSARRSGGGHAVAGAARSAGLRRRGQPHRAHRDRPQVARDSQRRRQSAGGLGAFQRESFHHHDGGAGRGQRR